MTLKSFLSWVTSNVLYHNLFKVRALSKEWASRAALPGHVVTMLNNFPAHVHPMSQLVAAVTALNSESKFAQAYSDGIHKSKYWEVSRIVSNILFYVVR